MKTEPNNNDGALSRVLKEWRIDAPLPPHFQEAVWQRIEPAKVPVGPSAWAVIAHWIGCVLPRPALAVSYVAILLIVGATVGWEQARHENVRVKGELGERYARTLDPYQAPR